MATIYIPIEFNDDEMLKEAKEIQKLADELGRKVMHFRVKAREKDTSPSGERNGEAND